MKKALVIAMLALSGCSYFVNSEVELGGECSDIAGVGVENVISDGEIDFHFSGYFYNERLDACVAVWKTRLEGVSEQVKVKVFKNAEVVDEFVSQASFLVDELQSRDLVDRLSSDWRALMEQIN